MNPLAYIGLGAIGLIMLLMRKGEAAPAPPPARTGPWSDPRWNVLALPTAQYPIASAEDLYTSARAVVAAIRANQSQPELWRPTISSFQVKAGLVGRGISEGGFDPNTQVTRGRYDAATRNAVGGYGGFTVEQTP